MNRLHTFEVSRSIGTCDIEGLVFTSTPLLLYGVPVDAFVTVF